MPLSFTGSSLETLHRKLLDELRNRPEHRPSPRGKLVHELIAPTFTLEDPRNRLILSPARNVNYGFAVGELCWYLRGANDLESILYYNKRASSFSDDGKTVNSCYGALLFNDEPSQWDIIRDELCADNDSRRAVMHINQRDHLNLMASPGTKDFPCTMSLQFLIRDRRLHLHVLMRSNDIFWGMPYDVFSFTVLQELMYLQLLESGVKLDGLGSYHHTCGSLHMYDYHFEDAIKILDEERADTTPMNDLELDDVEYLVTIFEPLIREKADAQDLKLVADRDRSTSWMCERLEEHRQKRLRQNNK